jgi:hypothetical protein
MHGRSTKAKKIALTSSEMPPRNKNWTMTFTVPQPPPIPAVYGASIAIKGVWSR